MAFNGQNWSNQPFYMQQSQGNFNVNQPGIYTPSIIGSGPGPGGDALNNVIPQMSILPSNNAHIPMRGPIAPNLHMQAQIASTFNISGPPSHNMQQMGPGSLQLPAQSLNNFQHSGSAVNNFQLPLFSSPDSSYQVPAFQPPSLTNTLQQSNTESSYRNFQGQLPGPFQLGSLPSHMQIPLPASSQPQMPVSSQTVFSNTLNFNTPVRIPVVAVAPFQTQTSTNPVVYQPPIQSFHSEKKSHPPLPYKFQEPENLSTRPSMKLVKPAVTTAAIYPLISVKKELHSEPDQSSTSKQASLPSAPSQKPLVTLTNKPPMTTVSINPLISIKKERMSEFDTQTVTSTRPQTASYAVSAKPLTTSQFTQPVQRPSIPANQPPILTTTSSVTIRPILNIKQEYIESQQQATMMTTVPKPSVVSSAPRVTTVSSAPQSSWLASASSVPSLRPFPQASLSTKPSLTSASSSAMSNIPINQMININKVAMGVSVPSALNLSTSVTGTSIAPQPIFAQGPVKSTSSSSSDIVINPLLKVKQEYLTEKGKAMIPVTCKVYSTRAVNTLSQSTTLASMQGPQSQTSATVSGLPIILQQLQQAGERFLQPSTVPGSNFGMLSPNPSLPGAPFPFGSFTEPPRSTIAPQHRLIRPPGMHPNLPNSPALQPRYYPRPAEHHPRKPRSSATRVRAPRLEQPSQMNTRNTPLFQLLEIVDKGLEVLFKYMCTLLPNSTEFMRVERFCTMSQKYKVKGIHTGISEEFYKSLFCPYITNFEVHQFKDKVVETLRIKGFSDNEILWGHSKKGGPAVENNLGWQTEKLTGLDPKLLQQFCGPDSNKKTAAKDVSEVELIKRAFNIKQMEERNPRKDAMPQNAPQNRKSIPSSSLALNHPVSGHSKEQNFPWSHNMAASSKEQSFPWMVNKTAPIKEPNYPNAYVPVKRGRTALSSRPIRMSNATIDLTDDSSSQMTDPSVLKCYLCCYVDSDVEKLWNHVILVHAGIEKAKSVKSKYFCTHCSAVFNSYKEVETHEKIMHLSENPCYFCGLAIHSSRDTEDSLYWQHIILKHSILHVCSVCKGNFVTSAFKEHCELTGHEKYPSDRGNQFYQCPYCNLKYVQQKALRQHVINCYSELFPVGKACKPCGRKFLDETALGFHNSCDSGNPAKAPNCSPTSLALLAQYIIGCRLNLKRPVSESTAKSATSANTKSIMSTDPLAELAEELQDEVEKRKAKAAKHKRKVVVNDNEYSYAFDEYTTFCEIDDRLDVVKYPKIMDTIVIIAIQEYLRLKLRLPVDEMTLKTLALYVSRTPMMNDFLKGRSMLSFKITDKVNQLVNQVRLHAKMIGLPLKFGDELVEPEIPESVEPLLLKSTVLPTTATTASTQSLGISSNTFAVPSLGASNLVIQPPNTGQPSVNVASVLTTSQPLPNVPIFASPTLPFQTIGTQAASTVNTIIPTVVPQVITDTNVDSCQDLNVHSLSLSHLSSFVHAFNTTMPTDTDADTSSKAESKDKERKQRKLLPKPDELTEGNIKDCSASQVKAKRGRPKKKKELEDVKDTPGKKEKSFEPQPSTSSGRSHLKRSNRQEFWQDVLNAYLYDSNDSSNDTVGEYSDSGDEWKPKSNIVNSQDSKEDEKPERHAHKVETETPNDKEEKQEKKMKNVKGIKIPKKLETKSKFETTKEDGTEEVYSGQNESTEEATDVYDSEVDSPIGRSSAPTENGKNESTPDVKHGEENESNDVKGSVTASGKKRRRRRKRRFSEVGSSDGSESDLPHGKKTTPNKSSKREAFPALKTPSTPSRWCLKLKRKLVNDTLSVRSERVSNRILQSYIYLHYYTDKRIRCCNVKLERLDKTLVSHLLARYFESEKSDEDVLNDNNRAASVKQELFKYEKGKETPGVERLPSMDVVAETDDYDKSKKRVKLLKPYMVADAKNRENNLESWFMSDDKPMLSDQQCTSEIENQPSIAEPKAQPVHTTATDTKDKAPVQTHLLVPVSEPPSFISEHQQIIDTDQGKFMVVPIVNKSSVLQPTALDTQAHHLNSVAPPTGLTIAKQESTTSPSPVAMETRETSQSAPTHLLVPVSDILDGVEKDQEVVNLPTGQYAVVPISKGKSIHQSTMLGSVVPNIHLPVHQCSSGAVLHNPVTPTYTHAALELSGGANQSVAIGIPGSTNVTTTLLPQVNPTLLEHGQPGVVVMQQGLLQSVVPGMALDGTALPPLLPQSVDLGQKTNSVTQPMKLEFIPPVPNLSLHMNPATTIAPESNFAPIQHSPVVHQQVILQQPSKLLQKSPLPTTVQQISPVLLQPMTHIQPQTMVIQQTANLPPPPPLLKSPITQADDTQLQVLQQSVASRESSPLLKQPKLRARGSLSPSRHAKSPDTRAKSEKASTEATMRRYKVIQPKQKPE